jgi:hypothetical protein
MKEGGEEGEKEVKEKEGRKDVGRNDDERRMTKAGRMK